MMQKYQNDKELVDKILGRDKKSLWFYYKSYTPRLWALVKVKIGQREDAQEVLQDILVASLDAMRDYSGQSSLYTYIYSIAKHKIVDYYRRKKIKHIVFSHFPMLEQLVSQMVTPEQKCEQNALKEKIFHCLLKMKPKYQKVLTLKYQEGFTVEEIATETKETIKSVESMLFRARRLFVKIFHQN